MEQKSLKEISEGSNQEVILFDKKTLSIKDHLAQNKVLVYVGQEKNVGFFKIHKDQLQLHVKIKDEWHWFQVIDASEHQKKLNKRLNYGDGRI